MLPRKYEKNSALMNAKTDSQDVGVLVKPNLHGAEKSKVLWGSGPSASCVHGLWRSAEL